MLTKENILKYLEQIQSELAHVGIINLGLFGSFAKGTETSASDIDIFFETTEKFKEQYNGISRIVFLEDLREKLEKQFQRNIDLCDIAALPDEKRKKLLSLAVTDRNKERIDKISKKIDLIFELCGNNILESLEDEVMKRPAILMHLYTCCELLKKLQSRGYHIEKLLDSSKINETIKLVMSYKQSDTDIDLIQLQKIIQKYLPTMQSNIQKL